MRLPDQLKAEDLEPLPVSELDEITAHRQIPGARIADGRLAVEVLR
jgi:hypothetical protein